MRTLIVGAGAVGRVLGWHLQRGGDSVGFLVRPSQVAELEGGIVVGRLGHAPEPLSEFEVVTTARDAGSWNRVILCVSSPALRRGDWLDELAAALPDALFVGIQPGLEDPRFVADRVDHLAWAMFPLMSWSRRASTTYWRPPLQAIPVSGPLDRVRPLVASLRRGGLPARVHADVPRALAMSGPLLEMNVVALECAGFRLRNLASDRELVADAQRAAVEAVAVAARYLGTSEPATARLMQPALTRPLLRLAPWLVPFDVEGYLRRHYTKVAEQTDAGLDRTSAMAAELGLPHAAIDRLHTRLDETRRQCQS